jgi:hypothetical protein
MDKRNQHGTPQGSSEGRASQHPDSETHFIFTNPNNCNGSRGSSFRSQRHAPTRQSSSSRRHQPTNDCNHSFPTTHHHQQSPPQHQQGTRTMRRMHTIRVHNSRTRGQSHLQQTNMLLIISTTFLVLHSPSYVLRVCTWIWVSFSFEFMD